MTPRTLRYALSSSGTYSLTALAVCLLAPLLVFSSCRRPIPTAPDREAIATVVSEFHAALAKGDRAAAVALLASDAQILETGHRQTREEYEHAHLGADIDFAQTVSSTKGALIVRQEGTVAWTTSAGRSSGTFQNKPVDSENTELMVLSNTEYGWRIRAIHWSAHSHGPGH